MPIKKLIRTIPDYPKKGIMFRDITTLIKSPVGLQMVVTQLKEKYENGPFDAIAGIEARGFIIGAALAYALNKGFIPVRKKGKLPGATVSKDYELEYGTDTLEVHHDAIEKGQNILLIDDLLATGGTAECAIDLIHEVGGIVTHCAFVVDLPELKGAERLIKKGVHVEALVDFQGH